MAIELLNTVTNNQPQADPDISSSFLLAKVEVHPDSLLVIVDGDQRQVEPRVMDLLVYGSGRPGTLLSKEQIMQDVWDGAHVVPEALQRVVSLLRKALGDKRDEPRFVETISKKGYRFLLTPEALPGAEAIRLTEQNVRLSPLHLIIAALVLVSLTWLAVSLLGKDEAWAPEADGPTEDQVEVDLPPPKADD
jgi:transcriptional activator of cad operon